MSLEYVPIWTLQDAVEYLIDHANATGTDPQERRKARRVVLDCYREFHQRDEWAYYQRTGQVRTQGPQQDGTASYDHTGGAQERLVTLQDATVPADGQWFTILLNNVGYPVETVVSSTSFTLPEFQNPGQDVDAGTYLMYRSVYPVPIDWRVGSEPIEFRGLYSAPRYVRPAELLNYMQWWNSSPQSWPVLYTIRGAAEQYSGMVFEFAPPPAEERTYNFSYTADPRPVGLFGSAAEYSTGTVSVSGTTVTGAGTVFSERMRGCVIRFPPAGSDAVPTGPAGAYENDNPYAEYRVVMSVESTTELTVDQEPSGTYSGVKYTIGDPLDLDYHVMLDAFLAMCRWKHAQVIKSGQKTTEALEAEWRRQFGRARAADYRAPKDEDRRLYSSRPDWLFDPLAVFNG